MMEQPLCAVCGKPLDSDVLFPEGGGAIHVDCRRDTGGAAVPSASLECEICGIAAVAGDHLVYDGVALVHANCQQHSGAGNAVSAFLLSEAGRPHCHSCLARQLGLRSEVVRKAVWALRVKPTFRVVPG